MAGARGYVLRSTDVGSDETAGMHGTREFRRCAGLETSIPKRTATTTLSSTANAGRQKVSYAFFSSLIACEQANQLLTH